MAMNNLQKLDDDFLDDNLEEEITEEEKEEKKEEEIDDDDLDFNDDLNDFGSLGDDYGKITPMEKHSDLLKGLTKFSPFIRTLYNNWLGIVWDEEQKKYVADQRLSPIMNIKGANWHASFIQTYVRDNNILAHLSRDEYYDLLEDINRTLLFTYAKRHKDFGFTCYSDIIRVWNEVEDASLLALSGAGGGKYTEFLGGGIVQYKGQFSEQQGNFQQQPYPQNNRRTIFGKVMDKLVGRKN